MNNKIECRIVADSKWNADRMVTFYITAPFGSLDYEFVGSNLNFSGTDFQRLRSKSVVRNTTKTEIANKEKGKIKTLIITLLQFFHYVMSKKLFTALSGRFVLGNTTTLLAPYLKQVYIVTGNAKDFEYWVDTNLYHFDKVVKEVAVKIDKELENNEPEIVTETGFWHIPFKKEIKESVNGLQHFKEFKDYTSDLYKTSVIWCSRIPQELYETTLPVYPDTVTEYDMIMTKIDVVSTSGFLHVWKVDKQGKWISHKDIIRNDLLEELL